MLRSANGIVPNARQHIHADEDNHEYQIEHERKDRYAMKFSKLPPELVDHPTIAGQLCARFRGVRLRTHGIAILRREVRKERELARMTSAGVREKRTKLARRYVRIQ